ncbi:MAG: hypothetical protein V9F00_01535 [Nocardioides sp.]
MRATLLLADSATQDNTGKIHALGIGWSVTSTPPPPSALIVLFRVPWHGSDQPHTFALSLVDADGRPVTVQQDGQLRPIGIEGQFEVSRPQGLPAGTDLDQNLCIPVGGGWNLAPGSSYEWRLDVDGRHEADWVAPFTVRA